MNVLIVGAGAVGQVYGLAIQRAAANVTFLVKPRHAAEARAGFVLHRLALRRAPVEERFEGFGVVTEPAELHATTWDQVWIAVSATAINGAWLEDVLAATGDATVVCLAPGAQSQARVAPVAGDRLVMGIITTVAYQAPLPGETRIRTPGIAWWMMPGPTPFSGKRAYEAVDLLRRGGLSARAQGDVGPGAAYGGAVLQVHVAALDSVGWSWRKVREGDTLALANRAWQEAAAVGAQLLGRPAPWWAGLLRPWMARLALFLAPRVIPMDVPTYFAYHFTKVGDQTRAHLDHLVQAGIDAKLPVDALIELRARLLPKAMFDGRPVL